MWCGTAPINDEGHCLTPTCRNRDNCDCHSPKHREYQKWYDEKVLEFKVSEFGTVSFI